MTAEPSNPPSAAPATELATQYVPAQVEDRLYRRWVELGCFTPGGDASAVPFTIVIPPPNVTGSLHIGHALGHTSMDALTRRARMQGRDALWLPGMDHAGIATQAVVERQLAKEGLSRQSLGREAFVERVWQWKAEYGGRILAQMRRLGDGVDWSRERFTMDEGLSRAVRTIFKRLYDDGLIYRAERLINWDPVAATAISDIEVDHREVDGELVTLSYGPVQVATTRVETMLGDTAVAVHPDDERYRHLVGTEVELPLTGRRIPVVADAHVDPEFGTGAVKVTPAHDPNDFEIGARHGLPVLTIMDEHGCITLPGPFQGLDRFEARSAVLEALREEGVVVAEVRPYRHSVGHSSRSGAVVEPRLSLQWFVKVEPLAKLAGDAVRDGRTTFVPAEMTGRYFGWVDDMHDWCISRQLWWGHRIPVWYGPDGEVAVPGPDEEPPSGPGWHQDEDVLDTWFSSALWPASTLGWPDDTPDLDRYYPTDVLVTGYDIIFFWVARMMMFCTYATGEVPFRQVALQGLVRDGHGRKMSKSAGNVVDPLELIDHYGADALRFTLARGANPGVDIPVSTEQVEASRNFVNKTWNAVRFALINGADAAAPIPPGLSVADRWILSRLSSVVAEVDELYDGYEFAKLCETLFHFARDEVYDWYVELAKVPLRRGGAEAEAARAVLGHVFDTLLRLLHPVVPFVTDELWQALTRGGTVLRASWPVADPSRRDAPAEADIARLQELVTEIRRFRAEQGLPPSRRVPAVLVGADAGLVAQLDAVAALCALDLRTDEAVPEGGAVLTAAGATVGLDLSGVVDRDAERTRLGRLRAAAETERGRLAKRLGNAGFVERAPAAEVARTRERLVAAEAELARLDAQLAAL